VPRFRYDDVDDLFDDSPSRPSRPARPTRRRRTPPPEPDVFVDERLGTGGSLSTYPDAIHGPRPLPDWVITSGNAIDTDRGPLKTGKEADVHLVSRHDPDSGRTSLLAAKRYRAADHRLFHRDAGYLEGRRVRRSRETRAMANRTGLGRELIAQQWAGTEFATWPACGRRGSGAVPGAARRHRAAARAHRVRRRRAGAAPRRGER
jgi:RIO kinase 1